MLDSPWRILCHKTFLINAYFHGKEDDFVCYLCNSNRGQERNCRWSAIKIKILPPAIAAMSRVPAKAFAANASGIILKAGSCPAAAFLRMPKKPGIDPSNTLPGWLPRKGFRFWCLVFSVWCLGFVCTCRSAGRS